MSVTADARIIDKLFDGGGTWRSSGLFMSILRADGHQGRHAELDTVFTRFFLPPSQSIEIISLLSMITFRGASSKRDRKSDQPEGINH